jgi:taurine dioxygenase
MWDIVPLSDSTFGAQVRLRTPLADAIARWERVNANASASLSGVLDAHDGLLVLSGLGEIREAPEQLVRLSYMFGPEVENYHHTLTHSTSIHSDVPEILIVSNVAPVNKFPPPKPEPELTADGRLPVQFPHRRGWHTDQSYRRPPPDVSLFYAAAPVSQGQGQTLYANGLAAYDALPGALRARADTLEGLHVKLGTGRSEAAAKAGEPLVALASHEVSQRQPVVRTHPVTGRRALYLCESGQMDWVDGPFVGMEPGPDGEGAALLYELMAHFTQPEFVYVHEWNEGDLVVYDNRTLIHAATWFDNERHDRVMWRTTVRGNPGASYAGEPRSWLPAS